MEYLDDGSIMSTVCVVVPCHNEESAIPQFISEFDAILPLSYGASNIGLMFVFVDDGSTDGTLSILRELSGNRKDVNYVSLSRNFGKEGALLCGMREALLTEASLFIVMDADLQDPPSTVPKMINKLFDERLDVVATYRDSRDGEPRLRSWFARRFYDIENSVCDIEMRNGARDFRIMTRRVVEAICDLPEHERFSKGLFQWVGFKTGWVSYKNVGRSSGTTSWSFLGLARYAVSGIVSFSSVPLEIISISGVTLSLIATIGLVFIMVKAILFGNAVAGWPSLVCIILFLGGLQLFALGIIGLYISKILNETKHRPNYIVSERSIESLNKGDGE